MSNFRASATDPRPRYLVGRCRLTMPGLIRCFSGDDYQIPRVASSGSPAHYLAVIRIVVFALDGAESPSWAAARTVLLAGLSVSEAACTNA